MKLLNAKTIRRFALGALVTMAAVVPMGSAGASTLAGTATLTNPANGTPLASGGSAATFTASLPSGAACSGDTATGGYHVYSFLVHQGVDPTTVTFVNFPSAGYGFVDNSATYYGAANTAINTGQIINIPNNFQWAKLVTTAGGALPVSELLYSGTSGAWSAGIACANSSGAVSDYWTTQVTFSASGADANGFTWAAVPGVPSQAPEVPLPLVLPILGAGVVVAITTWSRRRSRNQRHAVQLTH